MSTSIFPEADVETPRVVEGQGIDGVDVDVETDCLTDEAAPETTLAAADASLVATAEPDVAPTEARLGSWKERWKHGIDWPTALWIGLLHVGALAAPFFFTWKGVGLTFFLGWLTGGVGICLGFHRMLTHASFGTSRPLRWFIAWLGGLAGEGSAIHWVANHRKHHVHSDKEGDPHSPLDGPWWSHAFWFMPKAGPGENDELHRRWAPDLLKDPVLRMLDKTFILWHLALGGVLFAIGYFGWDLYTAWSLVVWGMFVRLTYVLHGTWLVNSATHMWGYRNYETTDESRNLWWVALITYGEGWHNNHHAHPRMARHGHKWWELDVTYLTICAMEKLGLCWNVVHAPYTQRRRGQNPK